MGSRRQIYFRGTILRWWYVEAWISSRVEIHVSQEKWSLSTRNLTGWFFSIGTYMDNHFTCQEGHPPPVRNGPFSLCDSLYSKSNFQTFYDTSHLETTCWVRVCLHGGNLLVKRQNPPGFWTNLWEIAVCLTNLSLPRKMQIGCIFSRFAPIVLRANAPNIFIRF